MGPITLFDKSFLQMLSLDEAVLFDNFFLTNICPIFFVETLADLEKALTSGRTPEEEVGIIAAKTPQMHPAPNMFHAELCLANFMGQAVTTTTGQIIVPRGKPVQSANQRGVVFDSPPETEAFSRWQKGEFLQIEREIARKWRETLSQLKFDKAVKKITALGVRPNTCKSLEEAKDAAQAVVLGQRNTIFMQLALKITGTPLPLWEPILRRWKENGSRSLTRFAPYAAYVVTVDLFFYIAVAADLISVSGKKITNRIDLAYLYYLPFCMVFASWDTFHKKCAPLFLRADQRFVWGIDLKAALNRLNGHYAALPETERERGLHTIADRPPLTDNSIITELWDLFLPKWRNREDVAEKLDSETQENLIKRLKEMKHAPAISVGDQPEIARREPDFISLERQVQGKRGNYWQVAKNIIHIK